MIVLLRHIVGIRLVSVWLLISLKSANIYVFFSEVASLNPMDDDLKVMVYVVLHETRREKT